MNYSQRLKLAEMVLPGHGYFGSLPSTQLEIPVNGTIDTIDVELLCNDPSYLNISAVKFQAPNGSNHDFKSIVASAQLSSTFTKDDDPNVIDALAGKPNIHSGLERRPRLEIRLKKPFEIKKIIIVNRSGPNGKRSRNLIVTAFHGTAQILRYLHSGDSARVDMLEFLAAQVGISLEEDFEGENRLYTLTSEIQSAVAKAVDRTDLDLDMAHSFALLPIYAHDPLVNDNTLIFSGSAVANIIARVQKIQTGHLKDMSGILNSPTRIDRVGDVANRLLKNKLDGNKELIVGKHNVGTAALLEDKDEYKTVIHIVVDQMREWGFETILCYGTLLGAVRDKGFIPYDDDVDMLYFDASKDRDDMMVRRDAVLQRFRDAGYKIWDSGTNFHVTPPDHKVGIDLFPCYTEGDQTALMMERYVYRTIPTKLLKPVTTIDLYGETFPAPADSEGFLRQRYGEGWSVSNPYYEWPWPLDVLEDWPSRKLSRSLNAARTVPIAWGQHLGPGKSSPPKNSPSLIKEAVKLGYDAIELDVRLSSDNVFVLGHDDVLKGPNGTEIRTTQSTAKQLSKFDLGPYNGDANPVIPLAEALDLLGDKLLHLDPRVDPEHYADLRKTIDKAGFDPGRIIFCGYGFPALRELVQHFPESVLLNKYYTHFSQIDAFILDDLKRRNIDGLMLFWPLYNEEFSDFMAELKARDLQVLFYCHGAWPGRGVKDDSNLSLKRMAKAGVSYVTTTTSDIGSFKALTKKKLY